ncbi:MAG: YjcQ protein [Firmicutes bacterium ADurb.Bin193]|nr:MAG: YjcQ protein [Firmicutes bacterium ADurb.Bin193]
MDNFKVIYRILKHLEASLDYPETDYEAISPFRLNVTRERWEQLLIMLQDEGYIKGIVTARNLSDVKRRIAEPITPVITLKGLEYLVENTKIKKAAGLLKGVKDTIPGF